MSGSLREIVVKQTTKLMRWFIKYFLWLVFFTGFWIVAYIFGLMDEIGYQWWTIPAAVHILIAWLLLWATAVKILIKAEDMTKRNLTIMQLVLDGETLQHVAEKNNLTRERVRQIVAKQCLKCNEEFYKTMPLFKTTSIEWLRINKEKFKTISTLRGRL